MTLLFEMYSDLCFYLSEIFKTGNWGVTTPLIAIIDIGATHSFISSCCVERLGLIVTLLLRGMVIDTPTNGSVTTSLVCAKCPVNFGCVDFELALVCLSLKHMDVIFGMD